MPPSRLKEAFTQDANLIGLAAVATTSMIMLNPLPLLVGTVAEVGYLLFAPDSAWIRSKIAHKNLAAEEQQRQAQRASMLNGLRDEIRARFDHLQAKLGEIETAAKADPAWATTDLLPSLEFLLDKFLAFANKEGQYRQYLETIRDEEQDAAPVRSMRQGSRQQAQVVRPLPTGDATVAWANRLVDDVSARYTAESEQLNAEAEREQDPDARALLEKRAQVLQQRDDYLKRAGRAIVNIHRQLTLLEDAFGLINDQIRVRPPDQIKADLDGVLQTTQMMTKTLDEMAQFDQALSVGTQG
jgi:hypothetical protein